MPDRQHFAHKFANSIELRNITHYCECMPSASHPHGVWTEYRVVREKDGSSSTEVHRRTGISLSHLSDLENGRRMPTPDVLKKLARALNCPVSVLERERRVDENGNDVALADLIREIVREELAAAVTGVDA
ncbi:helix-turn-helix domain-containing protein [Mycobacteroides abscessus]|uniref:helix-turn-helix domain-containing protein n=2 Tax=Mycobacteroides abscessus TaxID=36809 RepID=UPI0028F140BC|nr:helix-turn-helix transcriptional regulator [Mycobacteroides abscessus]